MGAKLRNRITQHIIDNNVLPRSELAAVRGKKYRSRKKMTLKNKLNVIEEASNESGDTCHFGDSNVSD